MYKNDGSRKERFPRMGRRSGGKLLEKRGRRRKTGMETRGIETRRQWTRYALCGALIGAGAILPGVSGGVLAVAFGVYRPFMECLTRPKRAFQRYRSLFIPLGAGWAAGFFLIARGVSAALSASETVCVWGFAGLIAGSVPGLYREAGREGRPPSSWAWLTLCAAGMYAGFFYIRHVLRFQATPNIWWYNFCGILWGVGTVFPGFSASPVMMSLGLYQPVLEDLSQMDVLSLACCLPGAVLSATLLARVVQRLFERRYSAVSHGILGVVCASAAAMIPTRYDGPLEVIASGAAFAAGFALAFWMGRRQDAIA